VGVEAPSREFTKKDWKRRYRRRRLSIAELVEAVQLFIVDATTAENQLRLYLESVGLAPGAPLLNADFSLDAVEQIGDLPHGGGYWFHGAGCAIKVPNQPGVDFDWRPDGTMEIDAWKIARWLGNHGARDVDPRQVAEAMSHLVVEGVLEPGEWWAFFYVVRRP